jgi:hypothetical protein
MYDIIKITINFRRIMTDFINLNFEKEIFGDLISREYGRVK